jgi:uncharacterized membrane protein
MDGERTDIFSNPIGLLPNGREIFEAFLDVPITSFSSFLGVIFFIGLMSISLRGIDRRDQIGGITYALFMCFCGTALILVINQTKTGSLNILTQFVTVLVIFLAAKLRWINRTDKQKKYREISTEETSR